MAAEPSPSTQSRRPASNRLSAVGAAQADVDSGAGGARSRPDSRAEVYRWFIRGIGFTLGVVLVYILANAAALALRALVLVFVAILLGSTLEPIVGSLRARLPIGRGAGVLLVYLAFLAIVIGIAAVVVPDAIAQSNQVAARLPAILDEADRWAASLHPAPLASAAGSMTRAARNALAHGNVASAETVVQVGLTVGEAAVLIGTLLAMIFFWLTEHARLQRYVLAFLPAERRPGTRDAWNEVETRLGLWVRGQLLLMGAMAVMTGILYSILGLPAPLLLALWAGIAEAIPMVGPLLGAVPALLLAATLGPQLVIATAIVYVALQFLEGNILVPLVMRNTIGISPFLVIVSLLVGAEIGGVYGAFLAVPITAAGEVILERLQARDVPVSEDPGGVGSAPEADAESMTRASADSAASRGDE